MPRGILHPPPRVTEETGEKLSTTNFLNMNKVIITTNDSKKQSLITIISNKQLKKLKSLEYYGDFKRFDLDHYSDDEPKKPSDYNYAIAFLSVNVFNTDDKSLKKIANENAND